MSAGRDPCPGPAARRRVVAGLLGAASLLQPGLAAALDPCTLPPCPASPNCVASDDPQAARRLPAYAVAGDPAVVWAALRARVEALPRSTLESVSPQRLRASVRSRLLGFVDDIELSYCAARGVVLLRSASRSGYWDLGVNRARAAALLAPLLDQGLLRAVSAGPAP